ncbi:MAG: outer membrane protein assembly factor BamD [Desulfosalsimonas sp.]
MCRIIKKGFAAVLCAVVLIGAAGCASWFGKDQEKTAPELAEEGEQYFGDEKYSKAIEAYERLRNWYPYSRYTKTAELRIADAHYNLKEYEQARTAYEYYERMHPGDSEIPYVIFRIGMCHYERIRSIDRTQVPTRDALEAFSRLQSRFPESDYAEKAEPRIKECRRRLAGHEFYVGRFYFKSGQYEAALNRFENLVSTYPDVEKYREDAAEYIALTEKRLEEMDGEKEDDVIRQPTGSGGQGQDPVPVMPGQ